MAEGPALEKRYPAQTGSWVRIPPSPPRTGCFSGFVFIFYVLWRDVREAEGARLEIVCAVNSGTEGSNPSLSAIIIKCLKLEV